MREEICGVYQIENKIDKKKYIGSSKDIYGRWIGHTSELKRGTHHSYRLQNAWNEYGEQNFTFSIIERCDINDRLLREQYYIDMYKSYDPLYGYNIARFVDNPQEPELVSLRLRGEGNWCALYTEKQILELIEYLKTGEYAYSYLSKLLGIKCSVINSVASHRSWKYLTDGLVFPKPDVDFRQNVKLSQSDVLEIIDLLKGKNTNEYIATLYGVNAKTISDIRMHKTWKKLTDGIDFPKSPHVQGLTEKQLKILEYKINNPNDSAAIIAKNTDTSISMVFITLRNHYKEGEII